MISWLSKEHRFSTLEGERLDRPLILSDNDVIAITAIDNYQIADIADLVSEEVAPVDVTYLEDEHPGPSYHVNFDRIAETGYEPEWTLREGVRDLAERFTR